jgi:hypothetical protein
MIKNMETFAIYGELHDAERYVQLACEQIILLHAKLEGMKKRYAAALTSNFRSMKYPLRMRIVTVEGFINLYYEYAMIKQQDIRNLRLKLYGFLPNDDSSETDLDVFSESDV